MASVSISEGVNAPAARVWELIRGFNDLPKWLPPFVASEVEGEGVGSMRTITMEDGTVLKERLDAYDDAERSYTYTITESPLPFSGYRSTIRVTEDGAAACTFEWSCTFEPAGAPEADVVGLIEGLYKGGMGNVRTILGV